MTAEQTITGNAGTTADPARLPDHEHFYARLTARNAGLIDPVEQQRLREARILVAGCGSIGGAAVEPLVRLGAEHLVLAEPDTYELHNLNRQHACLDDVGCNKATALAVWAAGVNPYAQIDVEPSGVTADTVTALVAGCSVVIDGVDVTASPPLRCKFLLHQAAQRARVPVISGYDIAGVQLVLVYDYRRPRPVLDGKIAEADLPGLEPMRFLSRVLPLRALPLEIFPVLDRQRSGPDESFPQLVYSARMFGVIASRLVLDLLAERPVRQRVLVDVHHLTRTRSGRARATVARTVALVRMVPTALAYRRAPRVAGGSEGGE
jgi:molybdopterin/thiamine biosynthesis adenylyltransferase